MNESLAISLIKRLKKSKPFVEGSSRKVYDIDNYIIKKAKNSRGKIECKNENWLYNNIENNYKQFLCPVLYYNGSYIIMEKAETVSIDFFESSIKEIANGITEYLWKTYQMDDFDLKCNFNWGLLKGNPVIIDYGHNYYGELLSD